MDSKAKAIHSPEILKRARVMVLSAALSMFTIGPAVADPLVTGPLVTTTPLAVPEYPVEVETEVGPAGSLKKVPLWKEIAEVLEDPYANECDADDPSTYFDESIHCRATTERRPFFEPVTGAEVDTMPPLNTFDPCHNVLTGQDLRYRPDGEIDWNQPGALFDPDEIVSVEDPMAPHFLISNIPSERRTIIGALVACPSLGDDALSEANARYACGDGTPGGTNDPTFDGTLIVNNIEGPERTSIFGFGLSAGDATTVLDADFESGTDGFTYVDDVFGTSEPDFADGALDGGELTVTVGGGGGGAGAITGISGGWEVDFAVPTAGGATLTLDYSLMFPGEYESAEWVEFRYSIDGSTEVVPPRLTGITPARPDQTAGGFVSIPLGVLSAGTHTLALGAFNNRSTQGSEISDLTLDNVMVIIAEISGSTVADTRIPPHQTVIATPACAPDGTLLDEDGGILTELEKPVNENNFFAEEDIADPYTGRLAAEILGKALFWDMQLGSDGVQSCGTCHFQAGIDVRTRNQLNPNTNGGDLTLEVDGAGTIQDTNAIDITTAHFPFHDRSTLGVGAGPGDGGGLLGTDDDANDVMSSMGVAAWRNFVDVLVGPGAFAPGGELLPDVGTDPLTEIDPVGVMQGNRRIEPRNTPTMHAAAFNFDNFWDARARHDFNGGSVFGPSDPFFHVFVNCEDPGPGPGPGTTIDTVLEAHFGAGTDGFVYMDDVFGTSNPGFADGALVAGELTVSVGGGSNSSPVVGISGGWEVDFTVTTEGTATLELDYSLFFPAQYESFEWAEVRYEIDASGDVVIDRLDGIPGPFSGRSDQTASGSVSIPLGVLSAGTHSLTLGVFNNQSSQMSEISDLTLDDVIVVVESGGGPGGFVSGELEGLMAPLEAEEGPLCEWNEEVIAAGEEPVPVRIRFSSLASQFTGPPLSDFEMAFVGRNWQKIGKRMLQPGVVPLANQLVDVDDSRLGVYSNQGGSLCPSGTTAPGTPGLCISYPELIMKAFRADLWNNDNMRLDGLSVDMDNDCDPGDQVHEGAPVVNTGFPADCDPFDGYVVKITDGAADPMDTDQFTQMEANFALFGGLSAQAYQQLLIPDHTPWDQLNDKYPMLGNGVAQPGEQGTLPPDVIRELITGSDSVSLDLSDIDGMDEDILFGFDLFAGGNLTAALPDGSRRNPDGHGANPFLRTARCMLCHLGPEQSDHTNNVNAGLLQSGTEVEFPTPPTTPEPTGVLRLVTGISLGEELEENAQDGVEVENRNFILFPLAGIEAQPGVDIPVSSNTGVVAPVNGIAFQDNGIYNVGVRPTSEDIMRGGDDPFGYPLSLAALALKNLGGEDFEPCDGTEGTLADPATPTCSPGGMMTNYDPTMGAGGGLYETVGDCLGCDFEGTGYFQESINPGLDLEPEVPMLPEYLAEWANNLPAGELGPQIDELAFAPNTVTQAPVSEYGEVLFGADFMCGVYDPDTFGDGPPNFGWGPQDTSGILAPDTMVYCPNSQTGVPMNMGLDMPHDGTMTLYAPGSLVAPPNGTYPWPNRVARNGAVKVPQLRNVELTGPYFHTGSYLTLRSVVDFYFRGGDFPLTNVIDRDPNLVDVENQAFGLGQTRFLDPVFLDGIPDVTSQYRPYPDRGHDLTPERGDPDCTGSGSACRAASIEDAKASIVKLLIAFTDERVAHRSAPFDQPETFVPIDGTAPAITGGRAELLSLSGVPCPVTGVDPECFRQIPATGRTGQTERLKPFLEIGSAPSGGVDHFDP